MCAPRLLALCLLVGLSRVSRGAGAAAQAGRVPAPPFVPRAPLPKSATKTPVSKGPLQNGVAPTQAVTGISRFPLKVFQEPAEPPIPFRFPSSLNCMQFKPLKTHNQGLSTKSNRILRWKIPQANPYQTKAPQITAAGNILQRKLPVANKQLTNVIQITKDSKREQRKFKYNGRRKISHSTENMVPQLRVLEAYKGLQREPHIPEVIKNKEPTKKSRPKIPRADMGMTFTPSTGLQKESHIPNVINNKDPTKKPRPKIPRADMGLTFTTGTGLQKEPHVPNVINNKEPTEKPRPKIPRADMGLTFTTSTGNTKKQTAKVKNPVTKNAKPLNPKRSGVKGRVKVKPHGAKPKSKTSGTTKRRPVGPKLPEHRNVKAATPMSTATLRNASAAPALRQREVNEPSIAEMKKLILKLMQQVLYTTQTDQLPVVEATANRHAQDTRFRMAFIFLRLDELKHQMHTMYTYLMKNYGDYKHQSFLKWQFSPKYALRNRIHLTYYTHFVRKNVDITYSVEYLLELCKSTDRQMERLMQLLAPKTQPTETRRPPRG